MIESRTEWWERALVALQAGRFNYELRQLHGVSNLADYAENPQDARQVARFTYDPNKLYETAIQIFTAASIEVSAGASILDSNIREALRTTGRLLYFLYKGESDKFAAEDLLLESAIAFELAGNMANSVVALMLRDEQQGEPTRTDQHSLDLPLYLLLKRRVNELRQLIAVWQRSTTARERIVTVPESCLQALSRLSSFLVSGEPAIFQEVLELVRDCARTELRTGAIHDWYLARGFDLTIQRFQHTSTWLVLRQKIGTLSPLWRAYIRGLALGMVDTVYSRILGKNIRGRSVIDLWPSQIEALDRGLLSDKGRDWVVRMPTSAGKTRIAEFSIVETLSDRPSSICVYVVPFIALANEVRNTLRSSLGRIGLRVGDLFQGEYELTELDRNLLEINNVIICTPEKLDLMLRRSPDFLSRVGLFIFDEGHMIDQTARGVRYEFLIDRLRRYKRRTGEKFALLVMSAVIPNAEDLAIWVSGSDEGLLQTEWKPTEIRYGIFHWMGNTGVIRYPDEEQRGEQYYVPRVIERKRVGTKYYPGWKYEICAELGRVLVRAGPVVIFAANKTNVQRVVNAIHATLENTGTSLPTPDDDNHRLRLSEALQVCGDYLGDNHDLVRALKSGFAYHTGDVPQAVRVQIEKLYSGGTIKLLVCTNTLAQGVNLPIKSMIVHSIFRAGPGTRLSSRDFMNMAGRAARALQQLEGQVIFVHDDHTQTYLTQERNIRDQQTIEGLVVSSIMLLYAHLAQKHGELVADEKSRKILKNLASSCNLEKEEQVAEGLAALDSQLLGLLVEEELEAGTIDASVVLAGSLFDIQSKRYGVGAGPIYADLSSKITDIATSLEETETRQRFFQTGLRRESCLALQEASDHVVRALQNAPSELEQAEDVIRTVFTAAIAADETKPRKKSEEIEDLFIPFWAWLNGVPVRNIERPAGISPEVLSMTIEDLFVRKVPWGIGSLYIIAEQEIEDWCGTLPEYLRFMPALSRYGVPTPVGAIFRAIGISDRTSAIRLAQAYSSRHHLVDLTEAIDWLAGLRLEQLVTILDDTQRAGRVFEEIQEAQLGNPGAEKFRRGGWDDVEVRGLQYHTDLNTVKSIVAGEQLALNREPDSPYDPNAIQVLIPARREMVGYVDRDYARIIAPVLDEGVKFMATVARLIPQSPTHPLGRLYVRVAEQQ